MRARIWLALMFAALTSACIITAPTSLLYNGAKIAGKTVYYSGKGIYTLGKMTVQVGDGVLDGTERMLRLTILTADAAGAVIRTTRLISASALEAELAVLAQTPGIIEVIVERADLPPSNHPEALLY